MNKLLAGFAVCCVLTACAGTYEWSKPGGTASARDADLMACGTRNAHMDKDDPASVTVIDDCMKARGYEKKAR
jgi:hypothetical protein